MVTIIILKTINFNLFLLMMANKRYHETQQLRPSHSRTLFSHLDNHI
jgi:hypothetical protein